MYFFYNLFLIFFFIIISPIILILFILKPKLRAGFWQKIGFYKKQKKDKFRVLVHAVSVGEVNAVEGFIKKIKETHPEAEIFLTTVTRTGNAIANSKLKDFTDKILYFPYDFVFSVKSFIKNINPDIVYIAETEIWPTFSKELKNQNIPAIIINGRISPSSYKGYKKFSWFFKKILSNYKLILMQSEADKKRIINIGANADIVKVMGNLKFDISYVLNKDEIKKLKEPFSLKKKKLIIAGSTHKGEDEIILRVFEKLKTFFGDLKLIIAPRHPERNYQVMQLIAKTGLKYGLKSKDSNFKDNEIILLDTMGELGKLYSISDIAFVGGSFSQTGGHNPLEPAIYNVPTVSGPDIFNFKDVYKYMVEHNAAIISNTEQDLYNDILKLLNDKDFYKNHSKACKKIFKENKGALDYLMEKFKDYYKN